MLTRLKIQNFKRFKNVDIELGKAVVFIGPNNSGKTTALQALVLWDIGLKRWIEPDAHLEILRQRQIYKILMDIAEEQGSQIIAASHSEVILNEAADRNVVIAFVGKPH